MADDRKSENHNPVNWPTWLRLVVLSNVVLVNFSFYTAPGIYSAAVPDIQLALGASYEVSMLGLSLFVIAYGIGPLVLSPISNLPSIGRTPVYVVGSLAFCLFSIGAALAKNVQTLLVLRFLAGFAGPSPTCIGGTTIAEIFGPQEVPYAMALYVLSSALGPSLGPVRLRWKTWSAALWLTSGIAALATLFMFFLLPETLSANILHRRAARLHTDASYATQGEVQDQAQGKKSSLLLSMIEQIAVDFRLSFVDPVILFVNIHTMFIYGVPYTWFEFFPYVFEHIYGFSQLQNSYAFFGILVGATISASLYCLYTFFAFQPRQRRAQSGGQPLEPEEYISPDVVGAVCIPVCLFIFAWTSRRSVPWIVPIIGSAFFAPGFHLTFQTVLNYLGQCYPAHVAGVFAGNAFFRSAFGGALPLAARSMVRSMGIAWASSVLGFTGLAMVPPLLVLRRVSDAR